MGEKAAPMAGMDTLTTIHVLAQVQRELDAEVFLLNKETRMTTHVHKIVNLRNSVRKMLADVAEEAHALAQRGPQSVSDLKGVMSEYRGVVDEIDATTAELRGALQADGDNGGPPLSDTAPSQGNSTPGKDRTASVP